MLFKDRVCELNCIPHPYLNDMGGFDMMTRGAFAIDNTPVAFEEIRWPQVGNKRASVYDVIG